MRRSYAAPLLIAVKVLHTIIWAFLAGSILALPAAALMRRFDWVAALTGLVLVECVILTLNQGRCPVTDWAARYTDHRAANFDIYLPDCIAKYNKRIFGTLFVCGEMVVLWCWLR